MSGACALQEVEMGTGSVALDVVYQNLAKSKLEAGTQVQALMSCKLVETVDPTQLGKSSVVHCQ